MQLSTVDFCSDFVRNCNFSTGDAVQFSIRSDPFFEVFLRSLLNKVDRHAYKIITYVYTIVLMSDLRQNLDF
jgi:hypothetical protein